MHIPTAQDKPTAEEVEMNKSLQEALYCTTCTSKPPKSAFYNDLIMEIYKPAHDPPFSRHQEDEVAPTESAPKPTEPGYVRLATTTQQDRYLESIIAEQEEDGDELYAQYKVDYHIHHHYLARCGVLTLCRDAEEMHALRRWRWHMDAVDGKNSNPKNGLGMRRWGWPGDGNRSMMQQTALWRRRWRGRQRRVEEARIKWLGIMEERKRQRQNQSVTVTVRFYRLKHGAKVVVREVEFDQSFPM